MQTIVVVNGALDWRGLFPGYRVVQVYLGRSRWVLERGRLWIIDAKGHHKPDAILWRLGAIEPVPMHRACLEMIRLSGVPCVNSAQALLRGYDRLSMLFELKALGLPVIDFDVFAGEQALAVTQVEVPAVLKVGNLHGGLGKARIQDVEQWAEMSDLVDLRGAGYATIEPFVDYTRDVRCMAVGDALWAMSRRSETWRANVETTHHAMMPVPEALAQWTRRAMVHLGADTLGLDFLEQRDGSWVLLESNDVPGVRGWPEGVTQAMARCVIDKLSV